MKMRTDFKTLSAARVREQEAYDVYGCRVPQVRIFGPGIAVASTPPRVDDRHANGKERRGIARGDGESVHGRNGGNLPVGDGDRQAFGHRPADQQGVDHRGLAVEAATQ